MQTDPEISRPRSTQRPTEEVPSSAPLDNGDRRSIQNVVQFARDREQNALSRSSDDLTRNHNLHSLAIQTLKSEVNTQHVCVSVRTKF